MWTGQQKAADRERERHRQTDRQRFMLHVY